MIIPIKKIQPAIENDTIRLVRAIHITNICAPDKTLFQVRFAHLSNAMSAAACSRYGNRMATAVREVGLTLPWCKR